MYTNKNSENLQQLNECKISGYDIGEDGWSWGEYI